MHLGFSDDLIDVDLNSPKREPRFMSSKNIDNAPHMNYYLAIVCILVLIIFVVFIVLNPTTTAQHFSNYNTSLPHTAVY